MTEDLGMLYIPKLALLTKVFRDQKGEYVHLPKYGKRKFYLKEGCEEVGASF